MTITLEVDNQIIIQQIGSAHVDNATSVEILRLEEQGWEWEATYRFPESNRCYVILSKPNPILVEEYNKAKQYIPHGWEFAG